MKIRCFTEEDRSSVIELWKSCKLTRPWNDPNKDIDRKIKFQSELFLVGIVDSKLVSSAMVGYDGHRGSVFYLAVHPDYQGLGYGKQLMRYIESLLLQLGCPKLNIVVRSTNKSVLEFYDILSYKPDDIISLGKRLISDNYIE